MEEHLVIKKNMLDCLINWLLVILEQSELELHDGNGCIRKKHSFGGFIMRGSGQWGKKVIVC